MYVFSVSKAQRRPLANSISRFCIPSLCAIALLSVVRANAQYVWGGVTGAWSVDANWTPLAVPLNDPATQLVFSASGTDSYTATNDIGSSTFNLNRLTVSNTGTGIVTIDGATTNNTLTFGGTTPTIDVTGTVVFNGLLAGTPTITKTGAGTFIHDSSNAGFKGTVIIDQGTFINRSTTFSATNFEPVSIVVNNGGTYQFGLNGVGDPNLPNSTYVTVNTGGTVTWQEGEVFGGFHLKGGTINLQAGTTSSGTAAQSWTEGVITGGNFIVQGNTAINKTSSGTVFVTGGVTINTGTGGMNIQEGTISMANAANLGTANVSLGNLAGTTAGTFDYQGVTASRGGAFTANAGGGSIDVGIATTTLTLTGAISGGGGLTKGGPGKLHFTGTLDNTGTTTVSAGTLKVDPKTASGTFAVASGAFLAVNSGLGSVSFAMPGLNFLAAASTLQFDLNTDTVSTVPLVMVTNANALVVIDSANLKVSNPRPMAPGTYTLIDYEGTGIEGGFNLSLPGRTIGNLVYDIEHTKIDVAVTGTDTVKWKGAFGGTWDVGSAPGVGGTNNWSLVAGGTATNFIDTDVVRFDDSATNFTVNLASAVQPSSLVVNATANYTFGGIGKLTGEMPLTKTGSGTLSLAIDNDYSGGTVVTQGTLQLGAGGTTGSFLGAVTLNGGALGFNRSDAYSFTNPIVVAGNTGFSSSGTGVVSIPTPVATGANTVTYGGTGSLVMGATVSGNGIWNKEGSGLLTFLANNNTFTGTLNVNAGTVLLDDLGGGGDFGASSIVVNNGGTFIFGPNGNTDLPDATLVTINPGGLFRIEQGENYAGFVLNGGEFRFVSTGKTGVNSTAIAAQSGAMVYDLRSGSITTDITSPGTGGTLNQGSGGVLTKSTGGTVTINGIVTFATSLPINIKEGTLAMGIGNMPTTGTSTISLGDTGTSGTLKLGGIGTVGTIRPIFINSGGGTIDVVDPSSYLSLNGTLSGTGVLTKAGNGTLILNGQSEYSGGTVITGGIVELNNPSGSGTGSGLVAVSGTLAGEGAISTDAGSSVYIIGTLQPGVTGGSVGVDFAISTGTGASTVFDSASVLRLDLWISTGSDQSGDMGAADRLLIGGTLDIADGATLRLANPNGLSFQQGDVFRLFDWSSTMGISGEFAVDFSELNLAGLTVDDSELYTSGTIELVAVPEPASAILLISGLGLTLFRRRRSS